MDYTKILTAKQKKVLDFISDYFNKNQKAPLIEEIKGALGFKSTRSVSQYLDALVIKKYIKRGRSPRSIQLLDPDHSCNNETELVPMYGLVSCGTPEFYADDNIEEHIPVDRNLLAGDVKNYYLVRASGTSMNRAGIEDSNLVLLRKFDGYENNERVLAVVDGLAIIKKVVKGDLAIMLMSESTDESHKPIIVKEDFAIAGKVICTLPDPSLIDEPRYIEIQDTYNRGNYNY